MLGGFVEAAFFIQGLSEITVGYRVSRFEAKRCFKLEDSLIDPARFCQCDPIIMEPVWPVGTDAG